MNPKSIRRRSKKVKITSTGQALTSQAGLIPVIKYLEKIDFEKTVKRVIPHPRGDNADYQLADVMLLTIIGILGGATSMTKVTVVWADGVLRKIAGWLTIPVETTVQRIFKELDGARINGFEVLNHTLRSRHGRRLVRSGISKVGLQAVHWIDVDSTVDSVCGEQEGSAKGYNPKKKGAVAYHPQLAFLADTKEILQAWFRTGSAYTSKAASSNLPSNFWHTSRNE